MIRSLSTAVLLLLLVPGVALAQNVGKLSGRVTDATSGEPLPGANVFLESIQRGAAADGDGNYTILGIPVGQYDVRVSFAGYQTKTETGVEISGGRTRTLDVQLGNTTLGEVVVAYERPLIQRDAIGVPKVLTGSDINNLPVRGVTSVAAIQAGVVSNEGSGSLNIRGGREQEVAYYVDGVKVVGAFAVPQQAIAEQEMLIGTIPPQYGDASSGVISISTRSGGNDFFGNVEAITSQGLDAYGYNLGSLSLGGPIVRNRASFFASVQGTFIGDDSPYALATPRLNDETYNAIQASPQVYRVARTDADGNPVMIENAFQQDDNFYYVSLPAGFAPGTTLAELATALGVPSASLIDPNPRLAAEFVGDPALYTTRASKDDPSTNFIGSGNIDLRPTSGVNLRLGGSFSDNTDRGFSFTRSLFNRDLYSTSKTQQQRGYVSLRQSLSNTAFYQIQAELTSRSNESFPDEFGNDMDQILFYGDIDAPQNTVAARYMRYESRDITDDGVDNPVLGFYRNFSDGAISPASPFGLFNNAGTALTTYSKFEQSQFRVSGTAQSQLGVHELTFGGEYESRTTRSWSIGAGFARNLARYYDDGSVEAGDDEAVTAYGQLPFDVGFGNDTNVSYYGYDYLGLNTVDDAELDDYLNATDGAGNGGIAPYNPLYYGGFIRDRIEFQDLVLDLGLRVDVFDNNTLVLRDPYSFVDIYRVSDIATGNVTDGSGTVIINRPATLPDNLESDYAVYTNSGNVVGYRSLDGRFFDAAGEEVTPNLVQNLGAPRPRTAGSGVTAASLKEYEPQLTIMPRLGVTFPVTDRALFFASYNVTSQRPSENAFATIQNFERLRASGGGTLNNPNLKPEITTQYELGFRQRVGEQAAVTLSGYYRTQRNKVTLRNFDQAFPAGYTTYTNQDFTTTKGVEAAFDLRRTRNLSMNVNYTLSFAEGTGSDSRTASIIAWRSQTGIFPETLAPLDFDQRHNANISVDYRLGNDEGPMVGGIRPLAGFGFNVLGVFKSGNPYTQLDDVGLNSPVFTSTNGGPDGQVNSTRLPFTTRVDLRVDRAFELGAAKMRGFLNIQNLLDQDNVFGVYRTTGLAGDDGFLSSNAGQQTVSGLGSDLQRDAYRYLYSQYVGGPIIVNSFKVGGSQLYGLPRSVRLGLTLDF